MSDYSNIKVKRLENSEMEVEGEILAERVRSFEDEAMRHLGEDVEMPGFRKGHVPPKMLRQRFGEMAVWTEAAEHALRAEYPAILKAALEKMKDAEPISAPEVTITKMAPGNPLGFKMKIALMPEVKLPDYKKITREILRSAQNDSGKTEVTDKEEKKMCAKEELRFGIIDAIVNEAKIVLPETLIQGEFQQMFAQFEGDVSRVGLTMADYMKRANKTEEDLKKEWRGTAEKRVKTQLVLHAIAEAEKLEPEKEKVEENVSRMMAQYKDADERRARAYITSVLKNERVFEFLENL